VTKPGRFADRPPPPEAQVDAPAPETAELSVQSGADIGQALREIRTARGLSLEAVADTTRVRRAYLADIEAMRLDRLPSRPFTIGYIRAYAEALGLDGEAAVERFKAEEPDLDEPLHAPVGVGEVSDPRMAAIIAGVVVLLVAIVLWNIAQRAMLANAPPPPTASAKAAAAALVTPATGTVALGAPLPAPVESTTPPLYQTPGLPDDAAERGSGPISAAPPKPNLKPDGEPMVDPAMLSPVFVATGKIYGAPAGQPSNLTLQALKSASLIVRGADGSIYFARQFGPGEAFRAPLVTGLTADVSEPTNFQVFVGGQSKGVLPAAQTSLTQLAQQGAPPVAKVAAPPPAAAPAAAKPAAPAPKPTAPPPKP